MKSILQRISSFVFGFVTVIATSSAQNVNMGDSYEGLDSQVISVTTQFTDATGVSTREPSGSIQTVLLAPGGHRIAQFLFTQRTQETEDLGLYFQTDLPNLPNHVTFAPFRDPTTDWANAQAYSLWKDLKRDGQRIAAHTLDWHGIYLRPAELITSPIEETARAHESEIRDSVVTVSTRFGALLAVTRADVPPPPAEQQPNTAYSTFSTRLFLDAGGVQQEVGLMRWFDNVNTLVWNLPGLTDGVIDDTTLSDIGGWPFAPNMAWANVQCIAFWVFHGGDATRAFTPASQAPGGDSLFYLDVGQWKPANRSGNPLAARMPLDRVSLLGGTACGSALARVSLASGTDDGCTGLHGSMTRSIALVATSTTNATRRTAARGIHGGGRSKAGSALSATLTPYGAF